MIRKYAILTGLLLAGFVAGCGQREQDIQIKVPSDPLAEPRAILQRYASGQPMGSEATSFPTLVANVRKVDPAQADILDKGFKDLQKAPAASRAALAKDLQSKLQPPMK
ncbi:MAG: hypothetical protein IT429_25435 [Gemmataceae bacterium]|nr:hypothetical protein [Gemmataceae bacterium]